MYRVAIITKDNKVIGKNFDTKDKLDDYLLSIIDNVKRFRIMDKETGNIIEDEKGMRKKK